MTIIIITIIIIIIHIEQYNQVHFGGGTLYTNQTMARKSPFISMLFPIKKLHERLEDLPVNRVLMILFSSYDFSWNPMENPLNPIKSF